MKVIAVANQKGGQGKTTVSSNLAVALAEGGLRVLALDLDPQFALTRQLIGREQAEALPFTLAQVLTREVTLDQVVVNTSFGFDLVPASRALALAEIGLVSTTKREIQLARVLGGVDGYDVVLIDCPPNLGLLTVNALAAAHEVLLAVSAEDEGGVSGVAEIQMTMEDLYADEPGSMPKVHAVITKWSPRREVARAVDAELRDWPDVTLLEARSPDLTPHHKATPLRTPAMLLPVTYPAHRAIAESYRAMARELGLVRQEAR